jgi:hypothetical protein
MAAKKPLHPLSLSNIPKPCLDHILHYLLLSQIKNRAASAGGAPDQEPHRFILYQYYKNFQLLSRLKGLALCLLKTQWAKKPKNPV